jgi:hypothetical protein
MKRLIPILFLLLTACASLQLPNIQALDNCDTGLPYKRTLCIESNNGHVVDRYVVTLYTIRF